MRGGYDDAFPMIEAPPAGVRAGRRAEFQRVRRRLAALGVCLTMVILAAAGLVSAIQRANVLAEARTAVENIALVLAEQTSRSIQPVDLTLREFEARLSTAAPDEWSSEALYRLLAERAKTLPQVYALMLIGADGHLVNVSMEYPAVRVDASTRDHFHYLSMHDDHALFISAPAKTQHTGQWSVFLSRRVNDRNGGFAGVVVATVTLSYLGDFYRAVTPANGSVTLLRRDGTILVRNPPLEQEIGIRLPAGSPWYGIAAGAGGSYRSPGYFNTPPKLVWVRPLRDFPLVVDVATTEEAALAVWRQQTGWLLVGALAGSGCVVLLLWLFGRQYQRLAMKNAQLETGRQRFAALLENMSQGLTLFDAQGTLLVCNRRYADLYRLSPDQVCPGTSLLDIMNHRRSRGSFPEMTVADYLARQKRLAETGKTFDITDEFPDGRAIAMHYRSLPSGGWMVTHEEVTERRRTDAALTFMARHDALTGLPNRVLFQERLVEAVAATRDGGHCALLCLDLDRFKVVNDTLGHPVGDSLLGDVAARLSAVVREGDTVARLGGDEFAIILANMKLPDHAASMAERILAAFDDPFDVAGHRIVAATSIGIALAPKDGTVPDALLQDADIALYLAKSEGRGNYRFFEPEIDSYIQRRRAVEFDLRNAVPAEDFLLHYQPVLDLRSGRVTGFEALVRWNHPVRGMVSPAEFIPIAEETGLIVPISAWVLQTACMEAAGWPEDIEIAVNLSPVQFKRGHLLEMVQGALAASGLAPNRLELEITESTLMDNGGDRLALLHKLRALGIRIALDDFGTGYSSLSYLRSFPFDKIKIDRSFIKDLDVNPDSATIVGAIVGLASGLRMTTVAEGVETERQLALVREQGIAKVQGYLFSRPRPASEVMGLIGSLRASRTAADAPAAGAGGEVGAERVVMV